MRQRSMSLVFVPNPLIDEPTMYKPQSVINTTKQFELQHEKTNKMSVHPAKTQISLGISVLAVRSMSS